MQDKFYAKCYISNTHTSYVISLAIRQICKQRKEKKYFKPFAYYGRNISIIVLKFVTPLAAFFNVL